MLGALSLYNTSYLPTTEIYEALNLDLTHGKRPGAYVKRSEALQHYATGLQAFPLPSRLEISEAAGIFDAWHKDRALHSSTSCQSHSINSNSDSRSSLGSAVSLQVLRIGR